MMGVRDNIRYEVVSQIDKVLQSIKRANDGLFCSKKKVCELIFLRHTYKMTLPSISGPPRIREWKPVGAVVTIYQFNNARFFAFLCHENP